MYNNPYLFAVPPSWSPFSDHVILARAAFLTTWHFCSCPGPSAAEATHVRDIDGRLMPDESGLSNFTLVKVSHWTLHFVSTR